jgi:hypothetical protein
LGREKKNKTRGVSHYGLAIYIKIYLKAKEESSKKNPPKETKILRDIITL